MEMNLGLQEVAQREAAIPWEAEVSGEREVTELSQDMLSEVAGGSTIIMID